VLEAALAAISSPVYFGPLLIVRGDAEYRCQDASPFGFTNPSRLAYHEAMCLFPRARLNTFVSLGAGLPTLLNLEGMSQQNLARDYMERITRVSSDTEGVHHSLARELQKR
jgi:hypothetical protein